MPFLNEPYLNYTYRESCIKTLGQISPWKPLKTKVLVTVNYNGLNSIHLQVHMLEYQSPVSQCASVW